MELNNIENDFVTLFIVRMGMLLLLPVGSGLRNTFTMQEWPFRVFTFLTRYMGLICGTGFVMLT